MKTIEFNEVCKSCNGTGLYVGMGERDGSAVVCYTCKGTGCHHFKYQYEDFEQRKPKAGVKRVYQVNPGITIGVGGQGQYKLEDFGGMPLEDWNNGNIFAPGMENRRFTCPSWWYQSADYKKKPNWDECLCCGSFSSCDHFPQKAKCWERWDKENS